MTRAIAVMVAIMTIVALSLASAHTLFLGSVTVDVATAPGACACASEPAHYCAPDSPHPWHGPVLITGGPNAYSFHGNVAIVPHHKQGDACIDAGECLRPCSAGCGTGTCNTITGYCDDSIAGYCADGYCCNQACDQGCGTCGLAGSAGTCTAKTQGTTCRPSQGACDPVAEACPGPTGTTPLACPPNTVSPATTICRAAAGPCDQAEHCDGAAPTCPADAMVIGGTPCRPAAGPCDQVEYCTGTTAQCPADQLYTTAQICRPATGPCDIADACTGHDVTCPADRIMTAGTLCRAAAGPCDVDDRCTGTTKDCVDQLIPANTACGPSSACSGASASCAGPSWGACQADVLPTGSGSGAGTGTNPGNPIIIISPGNPTSSQ